MTGGMTSLDSAGRRLPLFLDYPGLEKGLPYVALGRFPTPVEALEPLGRELGVGRLAIKRDDLSGAAYGGNKVRKLEFLLGAARRAGAREVVTVGFAGSNHALATALYARALGLRCTALLLPQVGAQYVRRNLLAGRGAGAALRHYRNLATLMIGGWGEFLRGRWRDGVWPYYIPPGGSCPLGVAGYVNAALELRDQIAAGETEAPDRIYVPLGSMGTAAGLALGLKAAGLGSQVVAVRVIEERLASGKGMAALLRQTGALLHKLDPAFPRADLPGPAFSAGALVIRNDYFGAGYARFTEAGVRAAELMRARAGLPLNGAYSAKAFAALLGDAARGELKGKAVLFWNTYNSRDLDALIAGVDYHALPPALQRYFEEEVQPLDRT